MTPSPKPFSFIQSYIRHGSDDTPKWVLTIKKGTGILAHNIVQMVERKAVEEYAMPHPIVIARFMPFKDTMFKVYRYKEGEEDICLIQISDYLEDFADQRARAMAEHILDYALLGKPFKYPRIFTWELKHEPVDKKHKAVWIKRNGLSDCKKIRVNRKRIVGTDRYWDVRLIDREDVAEIVQFNRMFKVIVINTHWVAMENFDEFVQYVCEKTESGYTHNAIWSFDNERIPSKYRTVTYHKRK